ncbi:AAA family ATPase [Acidithiobacillus thiooxidans]|uniref:AAA family ATPase n=2 Tax=Acidithiobacillus thiooxidans TaxID=930 RepID=A0A1C2IM41_ACITH|nr:MULTISPECIES: MoxR family ATPase [Acidithiobacillus]MBU2741138.1 MoxR family ATPase [Acidithiobacillus albertensis]MBU2794261.1 MoxR family ATPase [Acidithiobacillus thiooxidans]MBU2835810.1 MoxR family ATPase [Acidithiobacillus thiooxidans]MBU2843388.1 MoxR family ATPase [Acidithiobacillus thiooxidans]MDA8175921.1 MoxR family ATPase [Acidithiobacillus sp.]
MTTHPREVLRAAVQPEQLLTALAKVLLGKERAIRLAFTGFLAGGHILVEDVPGVGKTTLALGLARLLGLDFARVQMTADMLPGDILGSSIFDPRQQTFVFHPGPVFHGVLLMDEINRASPRSQSALLEAMAEGQVSADGQSMALPDPFFVIATQNPQEHAGVFPLPESQLDRFTLRFSLGYPGREAERLLLQGKNQRPEDLPIVAERSVLQAWRHAVTAVFLSAEIEDMLLHMARCSRNDERLRMGLSPRALLALKASAQAWAFIAGRDYVTPDDLRSVALAVLGHRLISTANLAGDDLAVLLGQEAWGLDIRF